jgi:hypothetical protein
MMDLGLNVMKPDRVVFRILFRLGLIDNEKDIDQVVEVGRRFAKETGEPIRYIDIIIVKYGQEGNEEGFGLLKGGICLGKKPRCHDCGVKQYCQRPPSTVYPRTKTSKMTKRLLRSDAHSASIKNIDETNMEQKPTPGDRVIGSIVNPGEDRLEITISKKHGAHILPHRYGDKIEINLKIGSTIYRAGVHETGQGIPWISSVIWKNNKKLRLVDVLQENGYKKGDMICIVVMDNHNYIMEPI